MSVVILQRDYRILFNEPYLRIGPGLSSISFSEIFRQAFDRETFYYFTQFLFLENHWALSLVIVATVWFAIMRRGYRYLLCLMLCLFFCYSILLDAKATRYSYMMQSVLILLSCGGCVYFFKWVQSLLRRVHTLNTPIGAQPSLYNMAALLVSIHRAHEPKPAFPVQSHLTQRHPCRHVGDRESSPDGLPHGLSLRGQHADEADQVVAMFPHLYRYYSGREADFVIHHDWNSSVIINPNNDPLEPVDRFGGILALINDHQSAKNDQRSPTGHLVHCSTLKLLPAQTQQSHRPADRR